jgi:hypothetical protein
MLATCPPHLILLDLITLVTFDGASHAIVSVLPSFEIDVLPSIFMSDTQDNRLNVILA